MSILDISLSTPLLPILLTPRLKERRFLNHLRETVVQTLVISSTKTVHGSIMAEEVTKKGHFFPPGKNFHFKIVFSDVFLARLASRAGKVF